MNEEFVTMSLIKSLKELNYDIISYDFPQSGTGMILKPNGMSGKNKGSIIPDVIANNKDFCIILENKDRFYENDFFKLNLLRDTNQFSDALSELKKKLAVNHFRYGIGIPNIENEIKKSLKKRHLVDFIYVVNPDRTVTKVYGDFKLFTPY